MQCDLRTKIVPRSLVSILSFYFTFIILNIIYSSIETSIVYEIIDHTTVCSTREIETSFREYGTYEICGIFVDKQRRSIAGEIPKLNRSFAPVIVGYTTY